MIQITRTQAAIIHKLGGIFDEDLLVSMPDVLDMPVPANCTHDKLHQVIDFVQHGKCTLDILLGNCANEAKFLGLSNAFDYQGQFDSKNWRFITALSQSPSLLQQYLMDSNSRFTHLKNWHSSSIMVLEPFNEASLEATPFLGECPPGSTLLPADAPIETLSWAHMQAALDMLPQGLPWAGSSSKAGIVLAGGAMESLLLAKTPNDYDLFLVMPGPDEPNTDHHTSQALSLVMDAINSIRRHHCKDFVYVSRDKPHVVDICVHPADGPRVKYQIITRVYASLAQVVAGFDIDSCRIGFDGECVRAHATAFRAWKHKWNVFNPSTLSTTALNRYHKKWMGGMGTLIPGVSQDWLESTIDKLATMKMDTGNITVYKLPLNLEGLLLFTRAAEEHIMQQIIADSKSDYDQTPAKMLEAVPCTAVWVSPDEELAFAGGPGFAPLFTGTKHRHNLSTEWYYSALPHQINIVLSFCIRSNQDGLFTGAFKPVQGCDIYGRISCLH